MIIPWQVDVPQDRYPVMNWLIVAGIVVAFVLQLGSIYAYEQEHPEEQPTEEAMLRQLFG